MSSSCPGEAILRLLGTDALDEAAFAAIEQHVEDCPVCTATLERLALADGRPEAPRILPGPDRAPRIPGFAIRRELGRGAMGVVYLAVEEGLDRPVALKVLPATAGAEGGPGARRRWLREARAVASIRHPNVVPLYDYGEADGGFYLVLEYVPGGTLKRRLTGPLPPREAAGLVETIARAVGCCHGRGLHHLDLKPSNILLDGGDDAPWERVTPRVSDFGLALCDGDAGPSETSLAGPRGTPAYMAPEQANASRGQIGAATDIHALGALLYELLTGRPPFQGASTLETLDQVRNQEPVPPRRLNPKIPRDLETICLKCLEKDPLRRYGSAEALADDLRRWLAGRPIAARPISPPERAWRWCRRRPAVAALAGTLALTLAAGFLSVLLLWRRAEAERRRAEADFQTANEVLGQIVEQSVPGTHLQVVNPDSLISSLQQTRGRLLAVAARQPVHPVVSRHLADVDQALGFALAREKRLDEARSHFDESLRCYQSVIQHNPLDHLARSNQIGALLGFNQVAKSPEEVLSHLRRAVDAGEELVRLRPGAGSICLLAETRNSLAGLLARRGDHEQARSVMDANRKMLENVPVEAEFPGVAAWRVFVRLDFDRFRTRSAPTLTAAFQDDGSGHTDPLPRLASSGADRLPARDWAELAAQALRSAAHADITPAQESQAGYMLIILLGVMAAEQRHCGQLGEARRTADRMLALGRLLVERHASHPTAHLALSEAYIQINKNAWQIEDRVAIERNLRLSLDAALQAQVLDPNNEHARFKVDGLQRRLKDLLAPP
jgi:tetratricopeptide (TPR) repeat protein